MKRSARRPRAVVAIPAIGIACVCAAGVSTPACAQADAGYPNRTIRLVVGFAPGGFTDVLARAIGGKLAENWRQQVVVDNRPGASTTIAADIVAKAAPDGYTLLMMTDNHVTNPSLYSKLPYDSEKDFRRSRSRRWRRSCWSCIRRCPSIR